jgi:hypothetical protein
MVETLLVFIFIIFLVYQGISLLYNYFIIRHYLKIMNNIHNNGKLGKLKFLFKKIEFILNSPILKQHLYSTLLSLKNSPYLLTKEETMYVDRLFNKVEKDKE